MTKYIIFLMLLSCTLQADYIPTDSSRSGLRVSFDFNSSIPISSYIDTYSAKSGMSIGYMIEDVIILDIGYEGLLNKNIVQEIPVNEGTEKAVFGNSFYYLGAYFKQNFGLRWALAIGVKAGYSNFWYELPFKDKNGDEISLDIGSKQILAFLPELNIYYRVREWLDASFRVAFPINSSFTYSYNDVFSVSDSDISTPYWGVCLHFGFY